MIGQFFPFFSFGIIFQVLALVHFIRKQPSTYWIWVILFLGPVGALVYLAVEALPELGDPGTFKFISRGSRIKHVRAAILDNPSAGNYEELGQLYLDAGKWSDAKQAYDHAISARTDSPDPFYRRGIAEIELGQFDAAVGDLERAVSADANYDFQRAAGLLAHAYAKTGKFDKAGALFAAVTRTSTLTETQLHYAEFLASQGKAPEARELAQRILSKRATMPGFQKRRERPLFRQTRKVLKTLAKS